MISIKEFPQGWGEVSEDLKFILGYPNFRAGPIAHIFQAAGYDIPRRAESEQAFVLHRMLLHYFQDPVNWRKTFGDELDEKIGLLNRQTTAVLKKVHTVVEGDTLSTIAEKHGLTWENLYRTNKKTIHDACKARGVEPSEDLIFPGTVLVLPEERKVGKSPILAASYGGENKGEKSNAPYSPMVQAATYIDEADKANYTPLQVLRSPAGWYVGTMYNDPGGFQEPGSRDSGYFATKEEAEAFLEAMSSDNPPETRMTP